MADHLLHISNVEQEGYVWWDMSCEHAPTDERWGYRQPDGTLVTPENPMADGCWLMSWWSELGREMLGQIDGPVMTPIPVRPADDWDYDNGGEIVKDETT